MPPPNYVNFTMTSGNVVCQRCKVLFPEEVELHFLHDLTGKGPGKNVCEECHQYYITKTEKEQSTGNEQLKSLYTVLIGGPDFPGQPSYSRQPTPGHISKTRCYLISLNFT
jgi:hypothetical protein